MELLLCVIKNEAKSRQKQQRQKTFFSFFERAKNQLISLTQQKKMNAFVRQKKRHTQEIKK